MFTNKKRKNKFISEYGKIPRLRYYDGDMDYIREYYDFRAAHSRDNSFFIDDITWNDLDMDRIFKRINPGLSTSGEQYLYYQLRCPASDAETYENRKALIRLMESSPDLRVRLQLILSRLGRKRRADLCSAFFPEEHGCFWLIVYIILAMIVPSVLIAAAVFRSIPILVVGLIALSVNAVFREYRKRRCQDDFDTVNYTAAMGFALGRIQKLRVSELDMHLENAYHSLDNMKGLLRTGSVLEIRDGGFGELLCAVLFLDLISYEFLKNRLGKLHDDVFAVHEALGMIDASISAASFRAGLESFAEPKIDFTADKPYIRGINMVHPLIRNAVPNSLDTNRPILITGSNASGKSTFLKTTALCAILAQSVCTATADSYDASPFRVYSSMALRDDLTSGESYYIAETKSLKRIIDAMSGNIPVLCAVDEVLRGTNTVERIAASSTILEAAAEKNAICLAATHDIELCELLHDKYELYHFEEQIGENEMIFDYKLKHGKAVSRNAINLLKLIGFDENIVAQSHRRANEYTENGKWR